ncbi:MAG TPA: HAMP domain-containing sensor histidine kinase [Candidatus Limnocylindria bacterium]|nr:HAMP domain-containing sensor histidine kinase [Candidatus Limnocylindria bacterium]
MPTEAPLPSPLGVAALALVGDGVTAPGLVSRFAELDARIDERAAQARLDELVRLGLVRVRRRAADNDWYGLTPLGERLLGVSFAGNREQAELLAEMEQMRTDLLSTIAHELRTPLTAVRTSIGLLLDPEIEPSSEEHQAMLEAIDRNATRMHRVVGEILELARFRAGSAQLQLRRFDARELAESAIASVSSLVDAHRQTIELDAPSEAVWVFGDYRRLEQAVVNLLSNAQKYSPDGTPIRVSVATQGPEVTWTVSDSGPGIEPADRARLFERFFVAPRKRSEGVPGIGLGLPISLLIVQAHEGRIDVDSEPGVGSTFRIAVPAAGPEGGPGE